MTVEVRRIQVGTDEINTCKLLRILGVDSVTWIHIDILIHANIGNSVQLGKTFGDEKSNPNVHMDQTADHASMFFITAV